MSDLRGGTPFDTDYCVTIRGGNPQTEFDALFPTVSLKRFFPLIMPWAKGCPAPTAEQNLRLALREFCERTRLWRYTVIQEVTCQDEIIACPSTATIHEIERAYWKPCETDDTQYYTLAPEQYVEVTPAQLAFNSGQPQKITTSVPGRVQLIPFAAGILRMTVCLKPRSEIDYGVTAGAAVQDEFNVCPEFLLIHHGETIAAGALARILLLPNTSFMNADLAAVKNSQAERGMDRLSQRGTTGQQRAQRRTKLQLF